MKSQPKNDGDNGKPSSRNNPPPPPTKSLIEEIPNEVLLSILNYIPSINLLQSASLTSHQFHSTIRDDLLWRLRLKALVVVDNYSYQLPSLKELNLHQVQQCCLFIEAHYHGVKSSNDSTTAASNNNTEYGTRPQQHILTPKSLLVPQEAALNFYNNYHHHYKRVALSSTTDNNEERIENVLPPLDTTQQQNSGRWWSQMGTYWSSAPSPTGGDSDETLLFTTNCPLRLIQEVKIKPFTEVGFMRRQTYTWCATIISVYQMLECREMKGGIGFPCYIQDDGGKEEGDGINTIATIRRVAAAAPPRAPKSTLIQTFLTNSCRLIYQSKPYHHEFKWNDEVQTYQLPPGVLGNVVVLKLVGKNFRQFPDSGYYVCVDGVEVRGLPLWRFERELEEVVEEEGDGGEIGDWFR